MKPAPRFGSLTAGLDQDQKEALGDHRGLLHFQGQMRPVRVAPSSHAISRAGSSMCPWSGFWESRTAAPNPAGRSATSTQFSVRGPEYDDLRKCSS